MNNKITYRKVGDYYLPNLYLAEDEYEKDYQIGKYGHLRLEYLKNHKEALYQELLMKDKLNEHLFSVSTEAENKVNYLINELIEFDGTITEKLKAKNQMLWIQKMNTCKNIAEEIVLREIVYGDEI